LHQKEKWEVEKTKRQKCLQGVVWGWLKQERERTLSFLEVAKEGPHWSVNLHVTTKQSSRGGTMAEGV